MDAHATSIRNYSVYLLMLAAVLFSSLSVPLAVLAEPSTIAVLYPDIREPYRSVFVNIISGIEDEARRREAGRVIRPYVLPENYDLATLRGWLQQERIEVIIALGTRGLMAAQELPSTLRIVIGAVLVEPSSKIDGFPVITLTPEPAVLFDRLKALVPGVRRIMVVYNPERNGWLIEHSQQAAKQRGLEVNALAAKDLREAAILYRDILNRIGESDALWLLQDPSTLDEGAILSLILRQSWDRNLVVFSSNPAHARRGVLFSMYPDNIGMGRSLAAIALNQQANHKNNGSAILPLQDLLMAVNLRTADRLGIRLTAQQRREFDLVFPAP